MSAKLAIDEEVLTDVVRALNQAIGVASVHAQEVRDDILQAAIKLDDAINEALEQAPTP